MLLIEDQVQRRQQPSIETQWQKRRGPGIGHVLRMGQLLYFSTQLADLSFLLALVGQCYFNAKHDRELRLFLVLEHPKQVPLCDLVLALIGLFAIGLG